MRLAAWNFSRRHSRSRHPSPCRLHFATGYYLKRPAFGFHLRITSFGRWDPLPLCLCLSQGTLVSYFCLSLNQHLPPANTAEISASSFEWKGLTPSPPNEPASIVFGRDSLVLTTEHAILAEFPYPTLDTTNPLTSTRYTLLPAAGSHFFARSSHSQGHKHPLRPSPPASHIPAPLCLQRWPSTSPAAVSPDLPSQASSPPPNFSVQRLSPFSSVALNISTHRTASPTPTSQPKPG